MLIPTLESIDQFTREEIGNNKKDVVVTTLYLKRFVVEADLVENNVCGGYNGRFEAELSLTVHKLEENGFVTDNGSMLDDVRYAFGADTLKASCEELAAGLINVAHARMGDRLVRATARVYNSTGHVDVVWSKGFGVPVPKFPRKATREEKKNRDRYPSSHC